MNSAYRQVGNAVPVLLAKALGKELASIERKFEKLSVVKKVA